MSVVGFDIGSESAVIAIARNNGIDIILNEASSRSTPVLVSFQGKQRHIGAAAEPLVRSNYKNTIGDMKRFLGRNYSEPSVQQELKKTHLTHKALANDEIGFLVNYNDKEEYFTPTQCLAMVFGKLKSTVEASTGAKSLNLVTSVPVYYTERQRRAVLDAAEISGLKALRLLNEPTACALGYGYPKSVKKQLDAEKPLTVMFADMGHTDFTVSIVEFYQGKMVVKGTAYDRNCGGHDIDTAIVGFLVEEFKKKTKLDCSSNPKAIMSLYRVAEKAKKTLSPYGVDTVAVNCECLYQDRDLATHLDINQFNKLCENLIPKIAATVERCLAVSQVPLSNINDVEIVGGSLRVRWAKEALAKAVNRKVDELMAHLNMDEACSRGCALQSAIISPTIRMQEFEIQDAVPYRINLQFNGILESADDATPTELEVFPRGHVSPYTVQVTFRRKKPFVIRAVYDASNKDLLAEGSNLLLGEYKIEGVPSTTDSGETPRVRVSVTHDIHGCFNVTKAEWLKEVVKAAEEPTKDGDAKAPAPVKDPKEVEITENGVTKTFTAVPLTVSASKVGAISAEQMVAFQLKEGQMAAQDRELVEKDAKKNELETYVYDMRDKLSEKLKPYVTPADADAFNAKLDEVESWLYSDEGFNGTLSAYQAKLEELRKKGDPITARYFESQERPIAVSEFNNALENVKTVVNKQGIDEAYFHLSDDDWSKLRQSCKDYKSWIAEEQYKQSALPATTSSPFTAASVRAKLAEFRKAVDPILTKPKPKVEVKKEEPKKEEAKKEEVKEDQDKMDVEKNEDADVEMEDANKK